MQPPYTKPTKCAVCEKCWMDPATGRCMCGGPFAGYQHINEHDYRKRVTEVFRTLGFDLKPLLKK